MNSETTYDYSRMFSDKQEYDKNLLQPLTYLLKFSERSLLRNIFSSFNHWLNVSKEYYTLIEDIFMLIQNSYIMDDDVENDFIKKNNHPFVKEIYGTGNIVNAANYSRFIATEKCINIDNPKALKILLNSILDIYRSRGMYSYWTKHNDYPSEEELFRNYEKRTGSLLYLGVGLLQLFSDNKSDFTNLCETIARYYHLCNDYLYLWPSEVIQDYCDVAFQEKFNFAFSSAINDKKSCDILLFLNFGNLDTEKKMYCLDSMEKYGTKDYLLRKIKKIHEDLDFKIKALTGNPQLEKLVNMLYNIIFT